MKTSLRLIALSFLLFFTSCYKENKLDTYSFELTDNGSKISILLTKQKASKSRHEKGSPLLENWDKSEWYQVEADVTSGNLTAKEAATIYLEDSEKDAPLTDFAARIVAKISDDGKIVALGCDGKLIGICHFGNNKAETDNKHYKPSMAILEDYINFDSINMREQIIVWEQMNLSRETTEKWMLGKISADENERINDSLMTIRDVLHAPSQEYVKGKISYKEYARIKDSLLKTQ